MSLDHLVLLDGDEIHRRVDPALVVNATLFHPRPDTPVLVLAVTDPKLVEAAVAPWLGSHVCVVRSRFRPDEVEAARTHLASRMGDWRLDQVGRSSDDTGQPVVNASAERVLPEMADWVRNQPEGLVAVDAWLVPDRASAAS